MLIDAVLGGTGIDFLGLELEPGVSAHDARIIGQGWIGRIRKVLTVWVTGVVVAGVGLASEAHGFEGLGERDQAALLWLAGAPLAVHANFLAHLAGRLAVAGLGEFPAGNVLAW
jgi:hypothetical protein